MLKFVVVTLAILSVAFGSQSVQFSRFDAAAVANLQLNGVAASSNPNSDNVLILTPSSSSQIGSAFLKSSINLTSDASFSSAFSFKMDDPSPWGDSDGGGADGIVFIINSVTNNVGSQGEGMGYQGLPRSVGIEFDSYQNGFDPNGNHVGVDIAGDVVSKVTYAYPTRFNNGNAHYAWVDYNGAASTLEVRISPTQTRPTSAQLSYSVNLLDVLRTPVVYVGFSAATGGAWERHLIVGWEFAPQYAPITVVPTTPPAAPPAPVTVCGNNVVEAGEQCDGGACCTASCTFASSASVCRPSAGSCDVAETCSGSSSTCPADQFASSSSVCRPSAGSCDVAETCSGSSSACPADQFASSSSVCRPAANGCDIAESCSGSSSACPADQLSQTGPCFCGRQGVTEPKDFPEYFCSPSGNLTIFYQCVYGAFLPQSAIMNCGAGTTCGCPNGGECSCNATRSPCVWANTLQQC